MCTENEKRLQALGSSLRLHNERGPIVFISAEAEPFSKYGGLANVVYELPRELVHLGEDVCVITPLYRFGDEKFKQKIQRAIKKNHVAYTGTNVKFMIQDVSYDVGVHAGVVDGVRYFLLDHFEFFDGLYWGYTSVERIRRRVAFARACAEVVSRFDLRPNFTFTNDAYAGLFNGIVRLDAHYSSSLAFNRNSFIHLIHNGGWQYFDSYERHENGFDLFQLFNLPAWKAGDFSDPVHGEKLNCMAVGIRCADRVVTVSPSYAKQLTVASDGLEHLLDDVVGINNAIGRDFRNQMVKRFNDSGLVKNFYPVLQELIGKDAKLRTKLEKRYPEILAGANECEHIPGKRGDIVTRVRNKLLMQLQEGLTVDPDKLVFSMIHRIVDQKGFQLLLAASEGVFRQLGYQGIIAGPVSHGDQKAEEIARGLTMAAQFYPGTAAVHVGFHDVSIPLLSSDVFLMPSMYEPGGISQLEAFACGCIVVARATGGLRDTVFPIRKTGKTYSGNGFLFTDFTPTAFFDAMQRCATFFKNTKEDDLQTVRENARTSVGYWDSSAMRYIEEIYGLKEIIRPETPTSPSGRRRRKT
jgi:starch synthase